MKLAVFLLGVFISSALITGYILWPKSPTIPAPTATKVVYQNPQIIHSNKWYSSIYKGLPSSPFYTYPLAFQFTSAGLGVSYPQINAQPKTVFASYAPDFIVSTDAEITSVKPEQIGDWHVKFAAQTSKGDLYHAVLAQGAPYAHLDSASATWIINFSSDAQYSSTSKSSTVVSLDQKNYLIVWEKGANATTTPRQISLSGSVKLYIALLPTIDQISPLAELANSPIQGTNINWQILPDRIAVTYTYTSDQPALVALLPHQSDLISDPITSLGTYKSLRGPMSVIRTSSFTLNYPKIIPPTTFATPSSGQQNISAQLEKDIAQLQALGFPTSQNYGASVWMGKVASLIQLSQALGKSDQADQLIASASTLLSESQNWYVRDATQSSLIAKNPEYGNERLNDHHFHYGYIIRLASVVCENRPETCSTFSPFVENLISDIATPDRQSANWPFLRNFDVFESHSWADGYGQSSDGSNQESSSEAINAWYAIYLWASQTHQVQLANTALYLYNAEIVGTQYYWFNMANTLPPEYQHQIASIVWGGKVDFATWFGDQTNYKYGIQILPLTPGSIYLSQIPNFFKYEADFLRSGGQYSQPWGELMLAWKSYTSKDVNMNQLPNTSEVVPVSILLYILHANQAQP